MPKKGERYHAAWWEIRVDDETGKPYWYGAWADDKEGTRFDEGEPLTLDPNHWPPGTRIDCEEPWDEQFYERLFAERDSRNASPSATPTPTPRAGEGAGDE